MFFIKRQRIGLLALTLLLCGCAGLTPPPAPGSAMALDLAHAQHALAKAPICCTRFSQFDFSQPLPAQPRAFSIGPHRLVADFGGTHSWFLAFTLPATATPPYTIVFKAELTGHWLHSSYLFAPSVVVLNASYQPLLIQDVGLCEYMGWTHATSGAFGKVSIHNPAARYLVVYSSAQQRASSTYWEQSPTAFSAQAPVQMAAAGSFQIPHGPNGILYLGRQTPGYHTAIHNAICAPSAAGAQ